MLRHRERHSTIVPRTFMEALKQSAQAGTG